MLARSDLIAFAATTDLERSHAFYGSVLGLRRVEASSFANVYDAHGTMLRVTRVDRVVGAPYTTLGWAVSDVDAAIGDLVAAGATFERFPSLEQDEAGIWTAPGGARIAWFRDPDGNTLSLAEGVARPADPTRPAP
jgi:catechol 2,3-dioxygenase-like lactoylglutathione lyase family enzyme